VLPLLLHISFINWRKETTGLTLTGLENSLREVDWINVAQDTDQKQGIYSIIFQEK
jgi:hypothetical protein